jgi:hypothetical protein
MQHIRPLLAGISSSWAFPGKSRPVGAAAGPIPAWAVAPNPSSGRQAIFRAAGPPCYVSWLGHHPGAAARWAGLPPAGLSHGRPTRLLPLPTGPRSLLGHARAASAGLLQPRLLQVALSWAALEQAAPASSGFSLGHDGVGLAGLGSIGSPLPRYEGNLIVSPVIWLIWQEKGQLSIGNLSFIASVNS